MIPPSRTPVWSPVESLAGIEVRRVTRAGKVEVQVIDRRTWTELVCLPPDEATQLAVEVVTAAGQPAAVHVEGDPDGWLSGTMSGPVELPAPIEVDDCAA